MTLSPVKSPLLLPEILVNIGRFLAKRELIACFQVCSTWHAALEPVLWADLNFEKQLLQSYFVDAERQVRILPDPPTIQRLARHITSIRYRGCQSPISLLILPHIVRLTRLRVFHHSSATLRSLILRNAATLVHIHWEEQYSELASVYRPPDLVDDMFSVMVQCQHLRTLTLTRSTPQIQCLQLEILTLNLTEIAQDKTIQFRVYEQLARLTRLKILTFGPAAENSRIGAGAGIAAGGGGGGAAPRTWMGIGMGVGTGTNAAAGVGAAGNAGGGGGGGAAVAGTRRLQHAIGSTPLNNMMTTLKKDEPDSMDFRLKYGLAQLATLKQLEEFRFEGLVLCKMDVDEIQWIANAWKSLRMVRGVLHKEKRRRARLESKLRELRPDVRLVSIDMCKVTLF
ncbi:hypothetical protein BGZ90_006740 [Linnemannia elongata]|nr:hypothetical protein BGZ90_006740 [Linnemannia elongata]